MSSQRGGAFLVTRHARAPHRRGVQSRARIHLLPALEEGRGDGLLRDGHQASTGGMQPRLAGCLDVLVSLVTKKWTFRLLEWILVRVSHETDGHVVPLQIPTSL